MNRAATLQSYKYERENTKEFLESAPQPNEEADVRSLAEPVETPFELFFNAEFTAKLRAVLSRVVPTLSDEQQIVMLYLMGDETTQDIADVLETSINGVHRVLRKVRARFKRMQLICDLHDDLAE